MYRIYRGCANTCECLLVALVQKTLNFVKNVLNFIELQLQTDQILEFLVNPNAERKTEREQICQEMLERNRLVEVAPARLQKLVKKAQFFNLAFDIAVKNGDPVSALNCLLDNGDKARAIHFITNQLSR